MVKADIGIKGGMIVGVGKAGNPDIMDGVTPGNLHPPRLQSPRLQPRACNPAPPTLRLRRRACNTRACNPAPATAPAARRGGQAAGV